MIQRSIRPIITATSIWALVTVPVLAEDTGDISFGTELVQYVIGQDARLKGVIDQRTGADLRDPQHGAGIAHVRVGGKSYAAASASRSGRDIQLTFGESSAKVTIRPITHARYVVIEVINVAGEDVNLCVFVDFLLKRDLQSDDPFVGCALALTLNTNVYEIPHGGVRMRAMSYAKIGHKGARVALIAGPQSQLRAIMKEVVSEAPELPKSERGGPWAMEDAKVRGSYLFNFGDLTEETVDDWIAVAKQLGLNQIDFHGGRSFRFGDCRPDPKMYPNGFDSLKAVIDRLHEAGIMAGLHTYAFFIAKDTPWVTPVPDPRLGKDATYTLAADISAEDTVVPVVESTEGRSTDTGFFVRNSLTLQIGDELITYAGLSKEKPYAFTKCTRGAHGTEVSAHKAGTRAHHLKQCFFYFCPEGDSTLLTEVAQKTADAYNYCGFDMMYLDALDGEGILGGNEYGWHYGSKFVFELFKRVEKHPVMEMSIFHHHLWYVRSRIGAWDHPNRSHKRFIDLHCAANGGGMSAFLPAHLGWWAVKTWHGSASEPTFPDDIAYLCTKAIAHDVSLSLMGVNPQTIKTVPAYERIAKVMRQHEELRRSDYFDASVKVKLAEPGKDFGLFQDADGRWRFREVMYDKHLITGLEDRSRTWTVQNPYKEQPIHVRVEAMQSIEDYQSPNGVTLIDFADPVKPGERKTAEGVTMSIQSLREDAYKGQFGSETVGQFVLKNTGKVKRKAAWAGTTMSFEPRLDLSKQQGLGLWVDGDGSGALLNIQLRSPYHISRAYGEHYVDLDFTGWRYVTLIEPEGERWSDYIWPYGHPYTIYRENVRYSDVASISAWFNHVPSDREVTCRLSPIKALPLVETQTQRMTLTVPTAPDDKSISYLTNMKSGEYVELGPSPVARRYGRQGELLGEDRLDVVPRLRNGQNEIIVASEGVATPTPQRFRVTVICHGDPI
jgi:hypothetical protein